MRFTLMVTLFVMLSSLPVFATNDNSKMGGMDKSSSMQMAKCQTGDPAVIVNTKTMTYKMDTEKNRAAMKGMMAHDKSVCKSQADKMGAKMIGEPSTMNEAQGRGGN